jgi:hypothetical protein
MIIILSYVLLCPVRRYRERAIALVVDTTANPGPKAKAPARVLAQRTPRRPAKAQLPVKPSSAVVRFRISATRLVEQLAHEGKRFVMKSVALCQDERNGLAEKGDRRAKRVKIDGPRGTRSQITRGDKSASRQSTCCFTGPPCRLPPSSQFRVRSTLARARSRRSISRRLSSYITALYWTCLMCCGRRG